MNNLKYILSVAIVSALTFGASAQRFTELELGSRAPLADTKMENISGEWVTLNDIAEENGLLVIFTCNTCPWVAMWEDRYNNVANWAKNNKVGFVLVNSNYQNRDDSESMGKMQQHAIDKGYITPFYVLDKYSKLANATGAKTTPHVFLYDGNLNLAYKGTIDDNPKDKNNVSEYYVKDALHQLGKGQKVTIASNGARGCGIKRKLD